MSTWFYRFVSREIIPRVYFWFNPIKDYGELAYLHTIVQPGDFLTSTTWNKLSSLIIPGKIDHAAIYVGEGMVVEMVGTGWQRVSLDDFWRHSTNMAVLRHTYWCENYSWEMCGRANSLEGTRYDLQFRIDASPALYCSELLLVCDYENRAQFNLGDLAGLGYKYLSPTGVFNARGCEKVFNTH